MAFGCILIKIVDAVFQTFVYFNENDILRFREEPAFCDISPQNKKYCIYFDEIAEKILKNVLKQNQKFVQK